ncbi:ABC transporter substrate-binding protein [Candidatus Bipolaricaulota bacterium]|nr:ABC transporter substrate-binding protein [Candidatus Bipolaricaulota bacterium]MBS3792502.1 ABC transporter substrate-binding protein [Candidatus Bipolaricaulota bacterium]
MAMSGALASYGPPINNGVLLAAKHLNEAGGVLGKEVKIITRDSKTDPTSGVDAARKLVNVDGVSAIVGPLSSGVTLPVAESVTIPNKIVQISPSATTPQLTVLEDDDYVFRTVVTDAVQGVILGQLGLDMGYESFSFVYVNNDYGKGLADKAANWIEENGSEVLAKVPYEKGKASYRGELDQATKGNPDVLILIGYPENGANIIRQAISGGYIDEFLLPDGMKAPELIENVGAQYLNGTFGTVPGTKDTPSATTFNESYANEFGTAPPKPFMTNAYDAAAVISLAMQKAGSMDSEAIKNNLRDVANPPGEEVYAGAEGFEEAFKLLEAGKAINYEGAGGAVNFNKVGDVVSPIEIWKIEDGKIVTERVEEVGVVEGNYVPKKVMEE